MGYHLAYLQVKDDFNHLYLKQSQMGVYCKSTTCIFGCYKIWRSGNNGPIWRILIWRFTVDPAQTYCRGNAYNSLNNGPIFKI